MKYQIIAIEREYASGGLEIGKMLGEELGIPCYGREILERAALACGTTPEQMEHLEETITNSFLYSIAMAAKLAAGQEDGLSKENKLYMAEAGVIWEMADQGPCVLMGHCASWALRERRDVLNVFIHADMQFRTARAVSSYGIQPSRAEATLKKFDKRRSSYFAAVAGRKWDDKSGYHLMLDSSKLGIETCVRLIRDALE